MSLLSLIEATKKLERQLPALGDREPRVTWTIISDAAKIRVVWGGDSAFKFNKRYTVKHLEDYPNVAEDLVKEINDKMGVVG